MKRGVRALLLDVFPSAQRSFLWPFSVPTSEWKFKFFLKLLSNFLKLLLNGR